MAKRPVLVAQDTPTTQPAPVAAALADVAMLASADGAVPPALAPHAAIAIAVAETNATNLRSTIKASLTETATWTPRRH